MGQEALIKLKNNIELKSNADNLAKQSSYEFLKSILENSGQSSKELVTTEDIHNHLTDYLNSLDQPTRKRRRSYQILQCETARVEKSELHQNVKGCKLLQNQMQWVDEMQETVRTNITEIMSTQKVFKIRQNFRRLVLKLLKIGNLWIYIVHANGRIEFHDFQNNFVTDIIKNAKSKSILRSIQNGFNQKSINDVIQLFDLKSSSKEEGDLYKWSVHSSNQKYKIGFLWKNYANEQPLAEIPSKMAEKIISITLISSFQEEITIIQNYSKDLLDILQLCIKRSELKCCSAINPTSHNFQDLQKWLQSRNKQAVQDSVTLMVNAFQQLKYELLERIRMYKRYVCEEDKIFMDFDEQAVLTFVSNNISHRYSSNLKSLYQKRKLFVENIFKQDKLINNFMKKALEKKIKHNKIYELDFQTKARIQYDNEGRIIRLHVIVEQTQNSSSHSSSNIYCSSSTRNLSDQSDQKSYKKENSHSTLISDLQKQNPGIINEGWINLFIKDNQVERRNTHLKNKGKKNYLQKRSYSLNRDAILSSPNKQSTEMNQQLNEINIESTDLNLLKMEEEILEPLVIQVFKKLDFFCTQMVNKQCFQNFLTEIHNGYQHHNNPFHNFTHGVNVMQTCFLLSTTPKIMELLNPFKIFTIVFSGLCHDVGHTGFTNLFEIASGSKKAITYNDLSPLENFHIAHTFQILRKPENNFLKDLSNQEMKQFRKNVISNILYTDIKQHFPLLKKFNGFIKDEVPKTQQFTTCLSGMIVHTSDFGGSAKQFQVCKQWSLKVNLEFSNQYKQEGELGLAQTPFMKDLNNPTILSKNESGFLKVIVLPLYQCLNNFNGTDYRIKRMYSFVENNITEWQKINTESQKPRLPLEI